MNSFSKFRFSLMSFSASSVRVHGKFISVKSQDLSELFCLTLHVSSTQQAGDKEYDNSNKQYCKLIRSKVANNVCIYPS